MSLHELLRLYEGLSKIYRTGYLEQELQMVLFFDVRRSCIAIL